MEAHPLPRWAGAGAAPASAPPVKQGRQRQRFWGKRLYLQSCQGMGSTGRTKSWQRGSTRGLLELLGPQFRATPARKIAGKSELAALASPGSLMP